MTWMLTTNCTFDDDDDDSLEDVKRVMTVMLTTNCTFDDGYGDDASLDDTDKDDDRYAAEMRR